MNLCGSFPNHENRNVYDGIPLQDLFGVTAGRVFFNFSLLIRSVAPHDVINAEQVLRHHRSAQGAVWGDRLMSSPSSYQHLISPSVKEFSRARFFIHEHPLLSRTDTFVMYPFLTSDKRNWIESGLRGSFFLVMWTARHK
jgi:hypothetical protein